MGPLIPMAQMQNKVKLSPICFDVTFLGDSALVLLYYVNVMFFIILLKIATCICE